MLLYKMTTQLIHDAVLGLRPLSPLCALFAAQPEHKRLRHIAMSQADVLYPSIMYTRREHCFSVMHLAREWGTRLSGDARLVDLVALAGLYHDVGHVTMSHTLDQYLCTEQCIGDHESRAAWVVRAVNQRLGGVLLPVEEKFVIDAITGVPGTDFPLWAYRVVHHDDPRVPDVDRITYLVHDARRVGFPCLFDYRRVTDCIRSRSDDTDLYFDDACARDIEQISVMRQIHFEKIFHHPVVVRYQQDLLHTFIRSIGMSTLVQMFKSDAWLQLTDTMLWSTAADGCF